MKSITFGKKGFTLIELLIVIAIILILIAIALPNFLEAQVRARVTRATGDMRTIAIALDMYFQDFRLLPDDHEPDNLYSNHGLFQLTSPIAYLTSLPEDPFSSANGLLDPGTEEVGWELASTGNDPISALFKPTYENSNVHAYALDSSGPDTGSGLGGGSAGGDDFYGNGNWPFLGRNDVCPSLQGWMTYSPTNGTKSLGDLVRVGGEHRSGRYCIDGWFTVSGKYPAHVP